MDKLGKFERPGSSVAITIQPLSANATTRINNTLLDTLSPSFFFNRHSRRISIPDVFLMAMTAFKAFAIYRSTDHLRHPMAVNIGPEWDITMRFHPETRRTQPPYCDFGWLIETVRRMPVFMLEQNRFAELSIGNIVDGLYVGDGLLEKGRLS